MTSDIDQGDHTMDNETGRVVRRESVSVQFPSEMAAQIEALAKRHERSRAGEVRVAVRAWIAQHADDQP